MTMQRRSSSTIEHESLPIGEALRRSRKGPKSAAQRINPSKALNEKKNVASSVSKHETEKKRSLPEVSAPTSAPKGKLSHQRKYPKNRDVTIDGLVRLRRKQLRGPHATIQIQSDGRSRTEQSGCITTPKKMLAKGTQTRTRESKDFLHAADCKTAFDMHSAARRSENRSVSSRKSGLEGETLALKRLLYLTTGGKIPLPVPSDFFYALGKRYLDSLGKGLRLDATERQIVDRNAHMKFQSKVNKKLILGGDAHSNQVHTSLGAQGSASTPGAATADQPQYAEGKLANDFESGWHTLSEKKSFEAMPNSLEEIEQQIRVEVEGQEPMEWYDRYRIDANGKPKLVESTVKASGNAASMTTESENEEACDHPERRKRDKVERGRWMAENADHQGSDKATRETLFRQRTPASVRQMRKSSEAGQKGMRREIVKLSAGTPVRASFHSDAEVEKSVQVATIQGKKRIDEGSEEEDASLSDFVQDRKKESASLVSCGEHISVSENHSKGGATESTPPRETAKRTFFISDDNSRRITPGLVVAALPARLSSAVTPQVCGNHDTSLKTDETIGSKGRGFAQMKRDTTLEDSSRQADIGATTRERKRLDEPETMFSATWPREQKSITSPRVEAKTKLQVPSPTEARERNTNFSLRGSTCNMSAPSDLPGNLLASSVANAAQVSSGSSFPQSAPPEKTLEDPMQSAGLTYPQLPYFHFPLESSSTHGVTYFSPEAAAALLFSGLLLSPRHHDSAYDNIHIKSVPTDSTCNREAWLTAATERATLAPGSHFAASESPAGSLNASEYFSLAYGGRRTLPAHRILNCAAFNGYPVSRWPPSQRAVVLPTTTPVRDGSSRAYAGVLYPPCAAYSSSEMLADSFISPASPLSPAFPAYTDGAAAQLATTDSYVWVPSAGGTSSPLSCQEMAPQQTTQLRSSADDSHLQNNSSDKPTDVIKREEGPVRGKNCEVFQKEVAAETAGQPAGKEEARLCTDEITPSGSAEKVSFKRGSLCREVKTFGNEQEATAVSTQRQRAASQTNSKEQHTTHKQEDRSTQGRAAEQKERVLDTPSAPQASGHPLFPAANFMGYPSPFFTAYPCSTALPQNHQQVIEQPVKSNPNAITLRALPSRQLQQHRPTADRLDFTEEKISNRFGAAVADNGAVSEQAAADRGKRFLHFHSSATQGVPPPSMDRYESGVMERESKYMLLPSVSDFMKHPRDSQLQQRLLRVTQEQQPRSASVGKVRESCCSRVFVACRSRKNSFSCSPRSPVSVGLAFGDRAAQRSSENKESQQMNLQTRQVQRPPLKSGNPYSLFNLTCCGLNSAPNSMQEMKARKISGGSPKVELLSLQTYPGNLELSNGRMDYPFAHAADVMRPSVLGEARNGHCTEGIDQMEQQHTQCQQSQQHDKIFTRESASTLPSAYVSNIVQKSDALDARLQHFQEKVQEILEARTGRNATNAVE